LKRGFIPCKWNTFTAASFGKFDIVKLLVHNGVNIDYIAEGAGRTNRADILKYCLKNHFHISTQVPHSAVYYRSYDIIIFINLKNNYYADATDLSYAPNNDDHVMFDMLLKIQLQ
jgi:hypothetical protein